MLLGYEAGGVEWSVVRHIQRRQPLKSIKLVTLSHVKSKLAENLPHNRPFDVPKPHKTAKIPVPEKQHGENTTIKKARHRAPSHGWRPPQKIAPADITWDSS